MLEYRQSTEYQREVLEEVLSGKRPDTLLLVQHPPVLTLGANFHAEHLLLPREGYAEHGIQIEDTERGGDVTLHNPGQLVAYPIFDVGKHGRDLHKWLRDLEEAVMLTCKSFELEGYRFPPHTGVWVEGRKICAIGIKIRRWVSMHGIALNCNNDLAPFDLIVPCGIQGYGVTSLSRELGREVSVQEVQAVLIQAFDQVFS